MNQNFLKKKDEFQKSLKTLDWEGKLTLGKVISSTQNSLSPRSSSLKFELSSEYQSGEVHSE